MEVFLMTTVGAVLMSSAAFASEIEQRKVTFQSNGSDHRRHALSARRPRGRRKAAGRAGDRRLDLDQGTDVRPLREGDGRARLCRARLRLPWLRCQSGGDIRFKEDPAAKTRRISWPRPQVHDDLARDRRVENRRPRHLRFRRLHGRRPQAGNATFRSVSLVAPWLHNAGDRRAGLWRSRGGRSSIATSKEAEASEQAGKPQVMIVAASTTDQASLMYQIPYYTEAGRGLIPEYDNKFNLASWEPWLTYDSVAVGCPPRQAGADCPPPRPQPCRKARMPSSRC